MDSPATALGLVLLIVSLVLATSKRAVHHLEAPAFAEALRELDRLAPRKLRYYQSLRWRRLGALSLIALTAIALGVTR